MPSMPTTNNAVAAAQVILTAIQNEATLAEMISSGDRRTFRLDTFNRQNIVRTNLVYQAWKQIGRQVLAMHPEVVEEVKVASSDKIPGEVMRVLPYMNPMVVFAEPPEFKTWLKAGTPHPVTGGIEDKMRLLGFLTFGTRTVGTEEPILDKDEVKPGIRVEQRIYSTNDPEANRFGILLVFEALNAAGKVIDMEFSTVTLYFEQTLTLSETVDALMQRYHWDGGGNGDKVARKFMRQVLSTVIGSLFYLCSTTLEAEKVPTKATRHMGRGITRKPLSLYRIGWTTGAALTRYRQSRTNSTSEQFGIEHQMQDPQHRRSHFKMQPYGPGLVDRKLIFVSAYWTHRERLGEEGVNVARSVPRVNGKGSARQSAEIAQQMVNVPKMEQV